MITVTASSIVFLAIVLLVVIYLTRKHWRIYCVLGAIVLSALVAWGGIVVLNEEREREQKRHAELINRITKLEQHVDRIKQELLKREFEKGKE